MNRLESVVSSTEEKVGDTIKASVSEHTQPFDSTITPKHIHFILLADGPIEFPLIYYIAIKSAALCNPGYAITLHCTHSPTGIYWSLLEGMVATHIVPMVDTVFEHQISRIEHRADVLRLEILLEHGGIYLDLDTICLKSFDNFLHNKTVMGLESDVGLCNAVIISPPKSDFLQLWYHGYREFHNEQWNEFSVILPLKLAKKMPWTIDIQPQEIFFALDYTSSSLVELFENVRGCPNSYILHLWNTAAKSYISNLNPEYIFSYDSTYNLAARAVIGSDFEVITKSIPVMPEARETEILRKTFADIYRRGGWGKGSGNGSDPAATVTYRAFLESFIAMNGIISIIDVGCGDWQSSRYLSFGGAKYVGFDLVETLVERNNQEFSSDQVSFLIMPDDPMLLPKADLLIMKDVLQHLSDELILFYRDKIFPKYRYCLITNSFAAINYPQNTSISPGLFRSLDLQIAPFYFKGAYVTESWNQWERIRTLLIVNPV